MDKTPFVPRIGQRQFYYRVLLTTHTHPRMGGIIFKLLDIPVRIMEAICGEWVIQRVPHFSWDMSSKFSIPSQYWSDAVASNGHSWCLFSSVKGAKNSVKICCRAKHAKPQRTYTRLRTIHFHWLSRRFEINFHPTFLSFWPYQRTGSSSLQPANRHFIAFASTSSVYEKGE